MNAVSKGVTIGPSKKNVQIIDMSEMTSSNKGKKEYPISDFIDSMFDGHHLKSCMEAIEKMDWSLEYKWDLMTRLVDKHGTDMFNLETLVHLKEETFRRKDK